MNKFEAQKLLDAAVSGRGFFRRGNAYFRIMGDGVLQLLKFEHERCFSHLSLCVGLYSMYSELEQRLFTSSGCIPQYSVMNFVGKSSAVNINAGDGIYTFEVISPPSQIQALNESVFYVLDNTLDQNQLIQQMNRLDIARRGSIIWNDLNKFAPYLKSGDIKSAENVLKSILMQHSCLANGSDFNSLFLLSAESLGSMGVEDRALIQRLNWLKNADWIAINDYLCCNQKRNNGFARFCVLPK